MTTPEVFTRLGIDAAKLPVCVIYDLEDPETINVVEALAVALEAIERASHGWHCCRMYEKQGCNCWKADAIARVKAVLDGGKNQAK